jgi:hypothetical protein
MCEFGYQTRSLDFQIQIYNQPTEKSIRSFRSWLVYKSYNRALTNQQIQKINSKYAKKQTDY